MTDSPPRDISDQPERRRVGSLVLVNTGHGKGKSTAAFGTMLRAVARGWNVCVIQFIKSGKWKVGEEEIGRRLGVEWWTIGDGFTWDSTDMSETEAIARTAWQQARDKIASGSYEMVILDEITYPMNWNWIDTEEVIETIRLRPDHVNIIATGRDAPTALIEVADTVTEMAKVKHAFDTGVGVKRGIDL